LHDRSTYERLLECSKGMKTINIEGVFHIFFGEVVSMAW